MVTRAGHLGAGRARASFLSGLLLTTAFVACFTVVATPTVQALEPAPFYLSQRQQDWETLLRVGRVVNAQQDVTDLVLALEVLDKPETSYANAVYQVFVRTGGRWQAIYTSTGARLITSRAGAIALEPEVISIQDLQGQLEDEDLDLTEAELRVSVQIRYDQVGGRRDQSVEFEQIQTYSTIAQITSVSAIGAIATQSTNIFDLDLDSTVPGQPVVGLPELPCRENCDRPSSGGGSSASSNASGTIDVEDTVTLSNGYRVSFLGVTTSGQTSTWRYYVEELPIAQDLSNWVLELPSCARVTNASPRGELVNPDPNARLSGIKWQPGGGFVEGEFSVTLSGDLTVGRVNVAVKGPDVALGELAGPTCNN